MKSVFSKKIVTDSLAEVLSVLYQLEVKFTVSSPKSQLAQSDVTLKPYYEIPGFLQLIQTC